MCTPIVSLDATQSKIFSWGWNYIFFKYFSFKHISLQMEIGLASLLLCTGGIPQHWGHPPTSWSWTLWGAYSIVVGLEPKPTLFPPGNHLEKIRGKSSSNHRSQLMQRGQHHSDSCVNHIMCQPHTSAFVTSFVRPP